jgi:hypothetical protein
MIMFCPALTTFTFYVDDSDKRAKIDVFLSGDSSGCLRESDIVNLTKSINAFNYVFGGDSKIVPICSKQDLSLARVLLGQGKIHAFLAGRVDANGKSNWYYSGNSLAVALILSNKMFIDISQEDLHKTVLDISEQANNEPQVILSGFEGEDLLSGVRDIPEDRQFVIRLKEKYSKKYAGGGRKVWPFC